MAPTNRQMQVTVMSDHGVSPISWIVTFSRFGAAAKISA